MEIAMVQPNVENSMAVPKKNINIELSYDPALPFLGICPPKLKVKTLILLKSKDFNR